MTDLFFEGCALTAIATLALLAAEQRRSIAGRWATKPLAAIGFLVAALGAGAPESVAGRIVLAGLVLSMIGDVLLITPETFTGGLVAFLLGHVAFAAAFVVRGIAPERALVGLAVMTVASGLAWRWLSPHVEARMRIPVMAYVLVITSMVVTASGASAHPGGLVSLVGAVMFYGSDLAVARNRFVREGFVNRAWGLPLYFAAQLVIAASTASF